MANLLRVPRAVVVAVVLLTCSGVDGEHQRHNTADDAAASERLLDGLLAGAVFFLLLAALAIAIACYVTNRCKRLRNRVSVWRNRGYTQSRQDSDALVWHSRTTTFINQPASCASSNNSANIRSPEEGFVNPGFEDFVQ
ncbi:hypothetical protein LSAT2_024853 [Lamellibrachia satsuma]|nr:hypothetical protein LSAT2_024853 [Lamellibrachia satsuma]